jgi:hypothetical protein
MLDSKDIIKFFSVFERVEKIADEINHYNDNEILNDYYKKVLIKFNATKKRCFELFDYMIKSDESLRVLMPKIDCYGLCANALEYIDRAAAKHVPQNMLINSLIRIYDTELIDARLVHAIFSQINVYENIFVYAGGDHIKYILPVLESLNYKNTITLGKDCIVGQEPLGIDVSSYDKFRQQHAKKQRTLLLMNGGTVLEDLSEEFNKNLRRMNKEIRKIRNSRKSLHEKKKLHHSFKNN